MVHKSGDHRLRWVVDPIIYIPGFFEIQTVVVGDFLSTAHLKYLPVGWFPWMVSTLYLPSICHQ